MEKQRISREEDERLMGISGILTVFIAIGGIVYFIHLRSINVISSFEILVLYALLWIPFSTTFCFVTYEILFSRRVRKPFMFYVKRFLSRMSVLSIYWLSIIALWSVLNLFLNQIISWKYILLIALFTASFMLALLVAIPKTRHLIKKLTKSE